MTGEYEQESTIASDGKSGTLRLTRKKHEPKAVDGSTMTYVGYTRMPVKQEPNWPLLGFCVFVIVVVCWMLVDGGE